jgi:hypothetical protein
MLISRCVEDISRYAAGDMDLQHTTETLINDMDRTETLGIRSFIVNNSRAIRRRRKTSGVSIWMWMILWINIKTDNENKKDRMIIAYPSLTLIKYLAAKRDKRLS